MDILPDINKKYTIIKKLGEGSFGKVYLVKNTKTNVIYRVMIVNLCN